MVDGTSDSNSLDSTDLTDEELQELLIELPNIIKELEELCQKNKVV